MGQTEREEMSLGKLLNVSVLNCVRQSDDDGNTSDLILLLCALCSTACYFRRECSLFVSFPRIALVLCAWALSHLICGEDTPIGKSAETRACDKIGSSSSVRYSVDAAPRKSPVLYNLYSMCERCRYRVPPGLSTPSSPSSLFRFLT